MNSDGETQQVAGPVLLMCLAAVPLPYQHEAKPRRPSEGQHQRGEQRRGHGDGQRPEEAAGDAADYDQREKDNHRGNGGTDQRSGDFMQSLAHRFAGSLAAVAVEDDVLDHHNGVVDRQADSCGQAAQCHQVEALADQPQHQHCNRDGDRNDQAGNQRGGPVAQKKKENDTGQDKPDEDGVAHAGDAVAHNLRLIVKGFEIHARRQLLLELHHLRGHRVGHGNRVAGGLAGNIQEHCLLAVGGDRGVDRHGGLLYLSHVGHVHRSAGWRGPHHQLPQLFGVVNLRSHQPQNQLMVGLVETGRIHDVRRLDGVHQVGDGHA